MSQEVWKVNPADPGKLPEVPVTLPAGQKAVGVIISDGGLGKLSVGDQELSVLARPGVNRLLKIPPTRVAAPYSESNTAQYTTYL